MPNAQDEQRPDSLRTVLLVDDEAHVRLLTEKMLERSGYEVVQASNGREAIEVFTERGDEIDVVLLDVMMPVMTGHEAILELRQIDPDLPVVFFSGYDQGEVAEHLSDPSTTTRFLAKPFTMAQLDENIRAALAPGG